MSKDALSIHELCREAILGYSFWSIFQGLPSMIWFYPLNELEVTGYEAFVVMLFSPLLFALPWLRTLLGDHRALAVLRLVSLCGLCSFRQDTTLRRLALLSVGAASSMLVLTTSLSSGNVRQRSLTCAGLLLGLFSTLVSRIWFTSFLPTWWSLESNAFIIALVLIATVDKQLLSGDDVYTEREVNKGEHRHPLIVGVSFGSLIYITHSLYSDTSILSRWTNSGFPDAGPHPYPYGACVLVSFWLGCILSRYRGLTTSKLWWLVGGAMSLFSLYYYNTWTAFIGGNVLCVYVLSIWPSMLDRVMSATPVWSTMSCASLVYVLEMFYSVWCTAYNFVPGGVYTRERSDLLLVFVIISIGYHTFLSTGHEGHNAADSAAATSSSTSLFTRGFRSLPDKRTILVLMILLLTGLGGFAARYSKQHHYIEPETPRQHFTTAIWTYHFGYDNVGWPSLERAAIMLNDTGADVITLLESDASKPYLGNNDLGMWLAERLGMYVDFGVSTKDHTWGCLLLSRFPILKSTHHMLPSPHGELAPAITATLDISGQHVTVVVTHMGNDRDNLDRQLQAAFLADQLKQCDVAVFLGYVTSRPYSRDYLRLTSEGQVKDIDADDHDRWCEYIMYKGLKRLGYARISNGGLSDTELQMARFELFPPASSSSSSARKDNNRKTKSTTKVKPEHLFSKKFGGYSEGHNWRHESQHRYHMGTPTYFLP